MQVLKGLVLVALAGIGVVGAADATTSTTSSIDQLRAATSGNLLGPQDLVVDIDGKISRSVKPSTPPVRLACDSGCNNLQKC
jgi:hypothetical protein